jgi:hypothetical protein
MLANNPLLLAPTLPAMNLASFDRDRGARFARDWKRRFSTTALNFESVRRTRNWYSCKQHHPLAGKRRQSQI